MVLRVTRRRAWFLVIAAAVVGLALTLPGSERATWHDAAGTAWAVLVGGPAFLAFLHGDVARAASRPARWAAAWLPLAFAFGIGREFTLFAARDVLATPLGLRYATLFVLVVVAASYAVARSPPPVQRLTLRLAPAAAFLALLPGGETPLLVSALAGEAIAVLHILGFRRAPAAWARATAAAAAFFAVGLLGVIALRGELLPRPRLTMSPTDAAHTVGVLAAAAALLWLAVLVVARPPDSAASH